MKQAVIAFKSEDLKILDSSMGDHAFQWRDGAEGAT